MSENIALRRYKTIKVKNMEKFEEIRYTFEQRINNTDVENVIDYVHSITIKLGKMSDKRIYKNDADFFSCIFGKDVLEAIREDKYEDYNVHDDYFVIKGYGNLYSYDSGAIKKYIERIAPEMAEIFAEDFVYNNGLLFEGIHLYEELQSY